MLSKKDDSFIEDTASSIGDSTWDLIDDGSIATSDDECHRLSRQQTPMSEGQGEDCDLLDTSRPHPVLETSVEDEDSVQDLHSPGCFQTLQDLEASSNLATLREMKQEQKTHTIRNTPATASSKEDGHRAIDGIWVEESATDNFADSDTGASTTAFATLGLFEGPKLQQLSSALIIGSDCKVIGTVRQSMADELYQPAGPYKILYVGPDALENTIMQKIGSALVSRLRPHLKLNRSPKSTFSVVPVSGFGSYDSPEVVLVSSSGLQISVNHCTSARIGKHLGTDALYVVLDNDETLCSVGNGPFKIISSSYTLSDLGIIFLDERDIPSTKLVQFYARSFMVRHRIPYILISSQKLWTKSSFYGAVDMHLPHLCIEARSLLSNESQVLARLPIDLASFMKLDAAQMSRSLAYAHFINDAEVVDAPRASESARNRNTNLRNFFRKSKDQYFYTSAKTGLRLRPRFLILFGAFLCSVLIYITLIQPVGQVSQYPIAWNSKHITIPQVPVPTSTSAIDSAKFSSTSSAIATPHSQSLSPPRSADLSPTVTKLDLMNVNKSERFMAYITENSHIIVQPPRWFNTFRKPPALMLSISRGNESLIFGHTVFANGTHTLYLKQNDCHGAINVTVWTTRKPLVKESMIVELGSSWFNKLTGRMDKMVITRNARGSLGTNVTKLKRLLAPARFQAKLLVKQVKTSMGLLRFDVGTRVLSLASKTRHFVLGRWEDNIGEPLDGFRGYPLWWCTFTTSQGRIARHFLTVVHSASSLPTHWVHSYLQKVKSSSILGVAENIRQYRETHLVESQTLAARLWWSVRGKPPSRPSAACPGSPGCKHASGSLSYLPHR